jgi:DNA-binding transcriptional LysR family regulator
MFLPVSRLKETFTCRNAVSDNLYLLEMKQFDANLLFALDALLQTGSVTEAAERTCVSVPTMSRTLTRIRTMMGDPIMVQARRGLVATPKALEMRARLHAFVQEGRQLTRTSSPSLSDVTRTVSIRADESLVAVFAAAILETVHRAAPKIVLRFVSHGEEAVGPLREGILDLDLGDIKLSGSEVKLQKLFSSRFVGVVREGHPLSKGKVTAGRYVEYEHISASRRGLAGGPIDEALTELGLRRTVSLSVPTLSSALAIAATSDLVAAIPEHLSSLAKTLYRSYVFPLPVQTAPVRISLAWHPRFDFDAVHRFVRESILESCSRRPLAAVKTKYR